MLFVFCLASYVKSHKNHYINHNQLVIHCLNIYFISSHNNVNIF